MSYLVANLGLVGAFIAGLIVAGAPPLWITVTSPLLPIVVGWYLNHKLKTQATRIQEVHVLVNSRLSKTLDALSAALTENIKLKDQIGLLVTESERAAADRHDETQPTPGS